MKIKLKLNERNPVDFFIKISGKRIVKLKYKKVPIVNPNNSV